MSVVFVGIQFSYESVRTQNLNEKNLLFPPHFCSKTNVQLASFVIIKFSVVRKASAMMANVYLLIERTILFTFLIQYGFEAVWSREFYNFLDRKTLQVLTRN